MTPRRVLVLAAHPDDEMGCVGTLARLAGEIHLLTFSACSDLNGPELVKEWRAAANLLHAEATILRLPNRNLAEHRQTILDVLDGRTDYDLVLTPATSDEHQDHAAVTAEAIRAFKRTTVLGYELPLNTVRESRLSAYVSLSEGQMNVKRAHAALYRSQAAKPYMDPRYIDGLARMRGVQCGAEYAEAFEVIRWVM